MSKEKDFAAVTAVSSPTRSTTVDEASPVINAEIERRVLRKLDFKVVPMLWFLFLVSFVDRGMLSYSTWDPSGRD